MATSSGTATSYSNLLTRLLTFLTGLGGGQAWTILADVVEDVERVVYLKGPGLAGTDEIYVSIHQNKNVGLNYYNLTIRGYTGYVSGHVRTLQPGPSRGHTMCLWNSSIPYWFIADGRSFKVVAKISTTYQHGYGGFFLPYATPSEYAYPMFIGGCHYDETNSWTDSGYLHKAYWNAADNYGAQQSSASMRIPSSAWQAVANFEAPNDNSLRLDGHSIWPGSGNFASRIGKLYDNSAGYLLTPFVLFSADTPTAQYGELDGVYSISGRLNAAENTQTISGDTYLVVPNVFRSSVEHYCAYKLV